MEKPTIQITSSEYEMTHPELLPVHLMHYIQRPQDLIPGCNEPAPKILQKHIPLKKNSLPAPGLGSNSMLIDGWGIYFHERVSGRRLWYVALVTIALSFVLAVVWSALTGDTQTGFTISGYLVTVVAVVVGILTLQSYADKD